MTMYLKSIAAVVIAAGLVSPLGFSAEPAPAPAAKKHAKVVKPKPAAVTPEQLQQLKHGYNAQDCLIDARHFRQIYLSF